MKMVLTAAGLAALVGGVIALSGCSGELGAGGEDSEAVRASLKRVRFYTPPPNPGALEQIDELRAHHKRRDARLIAKMIDEPQAVWFTGGTPHGVRHDVRKVMKRAKKRHEVPILVAYNIPFRDCSQFSAGGATTTEEYLDWIDGFARGIGNGPAVVILEPDGLGIIPYHTDLDGNAEWCQPGEAAPDTAAEDRYTQLNAAVDRLNEQPGVRVYLDATHSGWLKAGDAAWRLVRAGVERAAGFFLNVSNYQLTEKLEHYGSWISSCIAFTENPDEGGWRLGRFDYCASRYYPATADDFSTWSLSDDWFADNLGSAVPSVHFVIDTSRNGQGPWSPPPDAPPGDPQDWCNPPDRGLGLRPAATKHNGLLDAVLWIKIPGESDGECFRWDPPGSDDPARGMMDPAAGLWFPEMALELAKNAVPHL